MPQGRNKKLLVKKIKKGHKGFPMATIAYYGPNNKVSTKVVCGVIKFDGGDVDPIKKWFSKTEIRTSEKVLGEVLSFINEQGIKSVVVNENIMGCPHEEDIDYPEGESCPKCNYWAGRDRITHDRIH